MPGERADVFRTGQDLPNQYPLWLSDKLRPAQTGLNLIKPDRVNEYRISGLLQYASSRFRPQFMHCSHSISTQPTLSKGCAVLIGHGTVAWSASVVQDNPRRSVVCGEKLVLIKLWQICRVWLGNLDSNQDKQSQSLLCYRYTIPHRRR
jgi:hypothetical protein